MREAEALIAAVREAAREHPDRVYQKSENEWSSGCKYAPDDRNPDGCIIGCAARGIGVELGGRETNFTGIRWVIYRGHFASDATPEEIDWLGWVQTSQDGGYSWGDAVDRADAMVELGGPTDVEVPEL